MSAVALTTLNQALKANWGNPNSIHEVGRDSLNALDAARRQIADLLDCQPKEIVFTSGGTESDNLAIQGVALAHPGGHIITSSIEHKGVLETCKALEARGSAKITYIRPDRSGVVLAKDVLAAITPSTRLISLMYVNNETGAIQPIREIGKQLEKINQTRSHPIWLHTDAVQAAGYLPIGVKHLHVDLLSISAHKLGGPKGVGLLFIGNQVQLQPLVYGGGQESGNRSGTVNVPGIVSFAAALNDSQKHSSVSLRRFTNLRDKLLQGISPIAQVVLNTDPRKTVPYIVNFSIKGYTSDELVIEFDRQNICISAASACASGSIEPSYVLASMNLPPSRARSSVRVSFGRDTSLKDIGRLLTALKNLLQ